MQDKPLLIVLTIIIFTIPGSFTQTVNFLSANLPQNFSLNGDYTTLYIGDFNGDGQDDFLRQEKGAWANDDSIDTCSVYLSNGDGQFTQKPLPETFELNGDYTNLYIGDFNGDGNDDFLRQEKGAWANNDNINTGSVFLSNGKGNFTKKALPESFALNGDYTNLYIGDFNGDGNDDFLRQEKGAWANNDSVNTGSVYLSNGKGNFTKVALPETFALNGDYTNLYIGDFNGDGRDDFLRQEKGTWATDSVDTGSVYLSIGAGTFIHVALPENFSLNGDFTKLYIGDFNGDGNDDFLRQEKGAWANDDSVNTADVFLSNGNGQFTSKSLPETFGLNGDYTNLYIGDFNGDGNDDFLRQEKGAWANDDNIDTGSVYLSNGKGDFTQVILPDDFALNGDFTNLYIGDFNGDGQDDFLRQEMSDWAQDSTTMAQVFIAVV